MLDPLEKHCSMLIASQRYHGMQNLLPSMMYHIFYNTQPRMPMRTLIYLILSSYPHTHLILL